MILKLNSIFHYYKLFYILTRPALWKVSLNNSTNINKAKNQISFQLIEHQKSRPGLGQALKWGGFKPVSAITTLIVFKWYLDLQRQYSSQMYGLWRT